MVLVFGRVVEQNGCALFQKRYRFNEQPQTIYQTMMEQVNTVNLFKLRRTLNKCRIENDILWTLWLVMLNSEVPQRDQIILIILIYSVHLLGMAYQLNYRVITQPDK